MNYSKVSYSPNLKNLWIKKWIKIEDNLQPLQQLVLNSLTIGVTCIRFELQYRTLFCILDLLLYPSQTPSFRLSSGVLENIFIHKLWTKMYLFSFKKPIHDDFVLTFSKCIPIQLSVQATTIVTHYTSTSSLYSICCRHEVLKLFSDSRAPSLCQ